MTMTIAVAGKGGTGKTTFTALLVKYIVSNKLGSVLAIDGDPSANLNLALGMDLGQTVGRIREDTKTQVSSGRYDASVPKSDFFEYEVYDALVEGDQVDLIAMGRPEGPGCYCAANNILRAVIDRLGNQYDFVVIDNEAGMEHISRQTTRHVDYLFVVSDPTYRGLTAAQGIRQLVEDLSTRGTRVSKLIYVINRVPDGLPEAFYQKATQLGVTPLHVLPADDQIGQFDLAGRPLIELSEGSSIYRAVRKLALEVGL